MRRAVAGLLVYLAVVCNVVLEMRVSEIKRRRMAPFKELMCEIDGDMRELQERYVASERMREMCAHALSGGKRIRAALAYAMCRRLYPNCPRGLLRKLTCVELVHNASLIIDDIMDEDVSRRGKSTLSARYGARHAQLCAFEIMTMAIKVMAFEGHEFARSLTCPDPATEKRQLEILRRVTDKLSMLIDGQMMDIDYCCDNDDGFFVESILIKKTASLFQMVLMLAWILAKQDYTQASLDRVESIGLDLGLAFQLYDDFTDVHSDCVKRSVNFVCVHGKEHGLEKFRFHARRCLSDAELIGIDTAEMTALVDMMDEIVQVCYRTLT